MRILRLVGVVLALIAGIWFGLKEGYDSWSGVSTTGQRIAAGAQVVYGVGAVASLWGLLARARWTPLAFAVFSVAVTITATLAPEGVGRKQLDQRTHRGSQHPDHCAADLGWAGSFARAGRLIRGQGALARGTDVL